MVTPQAFAGIQIPLVVKGSHLAIEHEPPLEVLVSGFLAEIGHIDVPDLVSASLFLVGINALDYGLIERFYNHTERVYHVLANQWKSFLARAIMAA